MSTFLGPIHYWLFNKIKLVEEREKEQVAAFSAKYGNDVTRLAESGARKFGAYYDGAPLETLIGMQPIHAYLAGAIEKVETREAALIKALVDKYGEDAKALAMKTCRAHGEKVARAESEEINAESADDVYRAIKNAYLDGMPCDHVTDVDNKSASELVELHSDCLHRGFWQNAGADEVFMCEYLGVWLDGFASAVKGASHERGKTLVKGAAECEDFYRYNKG
jgi:hypothetical protein